MLLTKKPVLLIILTIAGAVFGFIFLLKSCLAKYDERSIKTPALVIQKDGKTVIFSIGKFDKTTSYSQKGGFTSKSVSTTYSIQTNDGETAELLLTRKIKNHLDIKNFPVEVLGSAGTTAWTFIDEPMAFDAFTLEKKADIGMLEIKNPSLKGKFPVERKYYSFNRTDHNIYFTATDGSKWQLNTATLIASASDFQNNESPLANKLNQIESEIKENQIKLDTLWQQKSQQPYKDYSAKKNNYNQYQLATTFYYQERERLNDVNDSLQKIKNDLGKNKRQIEDKERAIESLQRSSTSFSQAKVNQDTVGGTWYGLYSIDELNKLTERVYIQNIYDETSRRRLFSTNYFQSKYGEEMINKAAAKNLVTNEFLEGGFLLNKINAEPIHLSADQSFIIVHKDKIGKDGKIIISNVTGDGKVLWEYNTQLSQWNDWSCSGNMLIIFATDNKNLSSGESNVLLCVDLKKKSASKYDYFTKKKLL